MNCILYYTLLEVISKTRNLTFFILYLIAFYIYFLSNFIKAITLKSL